MRTEAVENTDSLRENTETEIFITDIGNVSNRGNLSDALKYYLLKDHPKPLSAYKFPSKFINPY